jgi:RNA polymerase sigma-70 factor (ECF subfamily)
MTHEEVGRLSEKQLVQQAQSGDERAFARLYQIHKRRVLAVCWRITREKTEAEDCAQEAFLQCFLQISSFRGESALSTWLYRLTVNVVLMRLRAKHGKPLSMETSGSSDDSSESPLSNAFPVEDLRLTGTTDRITIHRALGELPPGYRRVFLLHDVEGKAHSEIARELGCSIGNSKSQLHQARHRLRLFLRRTRTASSKPSRASKLRAQSAMSKQILNLVPGESKRKRDFGLKLVGADDGHGVSGQHWDSPAFSSDEMSPSIAVSNSRETSDLVT